MILFTYDEYTDYQEFYLELTPESKEMDKDILIRNLPESCRLLKDNRLLRVFITQELSLGTIFLLV